MSSSSSLSTATTTSSPSSSPPSSSSSTMQSLSSSSSPSADFTNAKLQQEEQVNQINQEQSNDQQQQNNTSSNELIEISDSDSSSPSSSPTTMQPSLSSSSSSASSSPDSSSAKPQQDGQSNQINHEQSYDQQQQNNTIDSSKDLIVISDTDSDELHNENDQNAHFNHSMVDQTNQAKQSRKTGQLICEFCESPFLGSNRLNKHMRDAHPKELPFYCKMVDCDFLSRDAQSMRHHVATKHEMCYDEAVNYVGSRVESVEICSKCHKCGRFLNGQKELRRHLESHAKVGYRCTWEGCGHFYRALNGAESHITNAHLKNNSQFTKRKASEFVEVLKPDGTTRKVIKLKRKSTKRFRVSKKKKKSSTPTTEKPKPVKEISISQISTNEANNNKAQEVPIREPLVRLAKNGTLLSQGILDYLEYRNRGKLMSFTIVSDAGFRECAPFASMDEAKIAFENDQQFKKFLGQPSDKPFWVGINKKVTRRTIPENVIEIPKKRSKLVEPEHEPEPEPTAAVSSIVTCAEQRDNADAELMILDGDELTVPENPSCATHLAQTSPLLNDPQTDKIVANANGSQVTVTDSTSNHLSLEDIKPDTYLTQPVELGPETSAQSSNRSTLKCDICAETFTRSPPMNKHYRLKHPEALPYHCAWPDCSYASTGPSFTIKHIKSTHPIGDTNPAKYRVCRRIVGAHVCPQCGRSLGGKKLLERHLASHTKSGYRCEWVGCGHFYPASSTKARNHVLWDHFGGDAAGLDTMLYLKLIRSTKPQIKQRFKQSKNNNQQQQQQSNRIANVKNVRINEKDYLMVPTPVASNKALLFDVPNNMTVSSVYYEGDRILMNVSVAPPTAASATVSSAQSIEQNDLQIDHPVTSFPISDKSDQIVDAETVQPTEHTDLVEQAKCPQNQSETPVMEHVNGNHLMEQDIYPQSQSESPVMGRVNGYHLTEQANCLQNQPENPVMDHANGDHLMEQDIYPQSQSESPVMEDVNGHHFIEQDICPQSQPESLVMEHVNGYHLTEQANCPQSQFVNPAISHAYENHFDDNNNSRDLNQELSNDDQNEELENVMDYEESEVEKEEENVVKPETKTETENVEKEGEMEVMEKDGKIETEEQKEGNESAEVEVEVEKLENIENPSTATKARATQQTSVQEHDPFCFECHHKVTDPETAQHCSLCPLTYHTWCVERANLFKKQQLAIDRYEALEQKPQDDHDSDDINKLLTLSGVCDECTLKIVGKHFNRTTDGFSLTSGAFKDDVETTYHNLANLLIITAKEWNFKHSIKLLKSSKRSSKKKSQEKSSILQEMDLKTIASKKNKYQSMDELLFDVKLIVHKRTISSQHNTNTVDHLSKLLAAAQEEARHILLCDSCNRLYYGEAVENLPKEFYPDTTYGPVFQMGCQNPHTLVWTKIENKWFPAKVFRNYTECSWVVSMDLVKVVTFGPQKFQTVKPSKLYEYSSEVPENGKIQTEDQRSAVKEVEFYLKTLDKHFFDCAIPQIARRYVRGNLYINTKPDASQLSVADQNDATGKNIQWNCQVCGTPTVDRTFDSCTVAFCSEKCKNDFL